MNDQICPPCPLCGETTACVCASQRGPFDLYDAEGHEAGTFTTVGLAVSCLRVLRRFGVQKRFGGHAVLIDRHGCPIQLPEWR